MSKQFFVKRGEKRRNSKSYSEAFQPSITENGKENVDLFCSITKAQVLIIICQLLHQYKYFYSYHLII